MKTTNLKLCVFAFLGFGINSAMACRPQVFANQIGVMLGKGYYCGFDTSEFFGQSLGALSVCSNNNKSVSAKAYAQFETSVNVAGTVGPVGETCAEFQDSYQKVLRDLHKMTGT